MSKKFKNGVYLEKGEYVTYFYQDVFLCDTRGEMEGEAEIRVTEKELKGMLCDIEEVKEGIVEEVK